jgi:hypothetical protein
MRKLVLDTNVCGKLLTPAHCYDVAAIKARISRKFKLVISPLTFVELLDALTKSDSAHFESHKERLRLMAGGGKPVFLRFPVAFALRTILGLGSPATKFGPVDFENWFRIVLRARSRDDLIQGNIRHPLDSRKTYGLNPAEISRQQNEGKAKHRRRLRVLQNRPSPIPPGPQWAASLARDLRRNLTEEEAIRFHHGLDAAYEYDKELRRIAAHKTYNFDKHDGDWIDYHQLFYLCDPDILLVTDDSNLLKRIGRSSQKDRILLLKDFLLALGFGGEDSEE